MNPGPIEEAGLTARSIVESFRSAPVALAVLIFNVVLLGGLFYTTHLAAERWEKLLEATLHQCGPQSMRLQSDDSREVPK